MEAPFLAGYIDPLRDDRSLDGETRDRSKDAMTLSHARVLAELVFAHEGHEQLDMA